MMFTETQHLSRQAIRVVTWIMISVTAFEMVLFGMIAFAERDTTILIPAAFTLLMLAAITAMMRASTMVVRVDADGVFVKARFFHRRGRFIPWSDVQRVRLRPLRAFGEFGGWGIRYGFQNATGYIYDGDHCLECVLHNRKKVVISVLDINELERALTEQGRITEQ